MTAFFGLQAFVVTSTFFCAACWFLDLIVVHWEVHFDKDAVSILYSLKHIIDYNGVFLPHYGTILNLNTNILQTATLLHKLFVNHNSVEHTNSNVLQVNLSWRSKGGISCSGHLGAESQWWNHCSISWHYAVWCRCLFDTYLVFSPTGLYVNILCSYFWRIQLTHILLKKQNKKQTKQKNLPPLETCTLMAFLWCFFCFYYCSFKTPKQHRLSCVGGTSGLVVSSLNQTQLFSLFIPVTHAIQSRLVYILYA